MHQSEFHHIIVAYASCKSTCFASIEKIHFLMEAAGISKVKRYGLTKNSVEADYGYNLTHPKFDKTVDMKIGIGKLSCIPNPADGIFQPVCRTWQRTNFALCLFGETTNLNNAADAAKKKGATFTKEAITPRGATTSEEISRAEVFLKLILRDKHKKFKNKLISVGRAIEGHYNLAFSVGDTELFIFRKGVNSQPFYIEKLADNQGFVSASHIKCLNEKNIIQIVYSDIIIHFTAGKEPYKKIELN